MTTAAFSLLGGDATRERREASRRKLRGAPAGDVVQENVGNNFDVPVAGPQATAPDWSRRCPQTQGDLRDEGCHQGERRNFDVPVAGFFRADSRSKAEQAMSPDSGRCDLGTEDAGKSATGAN